MADHGNITTPNAADLDTAARKYCASQGWAMPDGAYPIRPLNNHGQADLEKAIHAVGRGNASHDAIRAHIMRRASSLGMSKMIPEDWHSGGGMNNRNQQIHIRESVLTGVDKRQRLIDLLAVPWNQESDAPVPFNGFMLRERFMPGAFDGLESSAGRISVNAGHDRTNPVGKIVYADPRHSEGLLARAKIAAIPAGDDLLQLADEDMLSPSVGYFTKSSSDYRINRRAGTVDVHRAFLDHVGLVGVPAYTGARVLQVREGTVELGSAGDLLPPTPRLDEFLSDPIFGWAAEELRNQ